MGRRRRRIIRVVKKTLPKIYSCPRCGVSAVRVSMKEGVARITCGSCGLSHEHTVEMRRHPIDIYNEFVDKFLSGKVGV